MRISTHAAKTGHVNQYLQCRDAQCAQAPVWQTHNTRIVETEHVNQDLHCQDRACAPALCSTTGGWEE